MEQPQFTQALYDAREIAMERMQADATDVGGEGLVGCRDPRVEPRLGSHIMEFVGVGTAITPIRDATHEVHEPPTLVMFTDDRGLGA
jgi:uncharacterized protein YbjQ (UPF0145 family)